MTAVRPDTAALWLAVSVVLVAACGEASPASDAPFEPTIQLVFTPGSLAFGEARAASVDLGNSGSAAVGPVSLVARAVRDAGGSAVPGTSLRANPVEVATLNPGGTRTITLTLEVPETVVDGDYGVELEAWVDGQTAATLGASFAVVRAGGPTIVSLDITGGASSASTGDVLSFGIAAIDEQGQPVPDAEARVTWRVNPAGDGLITSAGEFVGYAEGTVRVIAEASGIADTATVTVGRRPVPAGAFQVRASRRVDTRYTSDHWEHGGAAYTGTWGCRNVSGGACGNALLVWDISDPAAPALTDSVLVDARVVNDVKVSADGNLAVITHEASNDGLNGVTLLDLADPLHPAVITRFAEPDLTPGVHNVWIEGDVAYLVVDGAVPSSGLRVLDISAPATPRTIAAYYGGSSFLHDVYVRDGLAFLSHWSAGLIILDVGNGVAGGSPGNPVEVSRIAPAGYLVHNAWYWPEAGYVFLGDEIGLPGRVLVVDASDLARPREVASFTLGGAAPHNFWVDEDAGIAYFAWYENGMQAVDVSGRLLGELDRQGRQIAGLDYEAGGECLAASGTCAWAPQLHGGLVYVSDLNSGLWVLQPIF